MHNSTDGVQGIEIYRYIQYVYGAGNTYNRGWGTRKTTTLVPATNFENLFSKEAEIRFY